ncbi:NAD(P)-dependent oxidoreductase [Halieaceae bacterium IMCC8485]|jgi:3-hydroxyisobutyrate dehydrogenase-like beta-hydroxyacid dehydrogenase|uniref:NAD(P)-dependent oxidoreductase n=1 Tax=Candidatus Seongchinamella marina TaxID=2518990 RepID=A0ABT3SWL2_9GAMM|nr:NAD(P)-dependent oxidoreductase [Candidatus Seongchinamella marina]MCX2974391.1 NAD(P)-dependent oxidoreductase [Candidatus Seongchinamella marina]
MKLAFIGLGVMGFPMAGHLQRAGHEVTVYNRTAEKAQKWVAQYGGDSAETPHQAVIGAQVVCLCVGNDDDVRSVMLGEQGIITACSPGTVVIDHTTASADLARELYVATAQVDSGFLDAPVSGGQAGAENGALTVMVGGEQSVFERAFPVIDCYARCARLLGPSGSGQLAKMANQICIAGIVQGLAEALEFSAQAGLDSAAVIEVISQGAAQSWQMENRYQTMLAGKYEHGFAVDWMRKDLGMVLAEADAMGLDLPVAALVDGFYSEVQSMGGGRWDTSSLFARMRAMGQNVSQEE